MVKLMDSVSISWRSWTQWSCCSLLLHTLHCGFCISASSTVHIQWVATPSPPSSSLWHCTRWNKQTTSLIGGDQRILLFLEEIKEWYSLMKKTYMTRLVIFRLSIRSFKSFWISDPLSLYHWWISWASYKFHQVFFHVLNSICFNIIITEWKNEEKVVLVLSKQSPLANAKHSPTQNEALLQLHRNQWRCFLNKTSVSKLWFGN